MEERVNLLMDKLRRWGATKIGFSYVGDILPDNLKCLKSAITVMIRLSDAIVDQIEHEPTHTYFHHYRSVNFLIDQITLKGTLMLQEWNYNAMAIPASQTVKTEDERYTAVFQHKTAATRAGLGWIGKNGLLITPEYGPRVRLGTLLTDMELPYGEPITESKCGECRKCVVSCPAAALHGVLWKAGLERKYIVDAHACSTHMHDKYRHIGRGSVCGICIRSCPVGEKRTHR
jgi:epoxyqueuosine reductase QueG